MKPVAIFQTASADGPGQFARFLTSRAIAYRVIRLDAGTAVDADPKAFSGIGLMGGPMSVNDDLPWIPPLAALIRKAIDADIPVIGHCLGGQLMSKALGGTVTASPAKEIGWGTVRIEESAAAEHWFGDLRSFLAFQWHQETFAIPREGVRIATGDHCPNQAFSVGAKHLAMQCHVEMTVPTINRWCEEGEAEIAASASPAVLKRADIEREVDAKVAALRAVAERLYTRWAEGLAG
jgi:GMP synthase-like glutamine amidotransferase